MLRPRHGPASFLVFLLLAPLVACSSSDGAGPDLLDQLLGRWEATSMVVTSVDDPTTSVDIVQNEEFAGTFVMIVRADGSYEGTLSIEGFPSRTETGTIEVASETLLILRPSGDTPTDVEWSLTGHRLTLDWSSTYDFNRDQIWEEEATLHLELVRG